MKRFSKKNKKQTLKYKLGFDSALSVSIHDITDARNLFAFDYLIIIIITTTTTTGIINWKQKTQSR